MKQNIYGKDFILKNYFGLCEYFKKSKSVKHGSTGDFSWIITHIPLPLANFVYPCKKETILTAEHITELHQIMSHHHCDMYCWWTNLQDPATNLPENVFLTHISWPGMIIDLDNFTAKENSLYDIQIHRVDCKKMLEEWVDVLIEGYHFNSGIKDYLVQMFNELGYDLPLQNYLAYKDGKPAGTAQLFAGEDSAGLYFVSVIKPYRRQGVGYTLSSFALSEAKKWGYSYCVLESSEDGYQLYRKLGFNSVAVMSPIVYINQETLNSKTKA